MKKQRSVSICTGGGGGLLSGCEAPAPVRVSETGRARNWTMPPLRLERECKEHSAEQNDLLSFCERRNSATIDNRCVEFDRQENQRCAFTMAEILLSLTIIGVVAAITLPSLTGNINERTWNTQRKALYARFSQAISLMPALNGYGTLTEDESGSITKDTAAETFVTNGLAKVLKINNICDSDHLADCGFPSKIVNLAGSNISPIPQSLVSFNNMFNGSYSNPDGLYIYSYSQADTKAAAFETQNGESILTYYNPNCVANYNETGFFYIQSKVCANFVYDLNGVKGPNTVGKDIGFITVFYPSDSVVAAPYPSIQRAATDRTSQADAGRACLEQDSNTRVPNMYELGAMFVNKELMKSSIIEELGTNGVWSSSRLSANRGWYLNWEAGFFYNEADWTANVWCIQR